MKINLLQVGDWTALYIDGKKVDENHSLDLDAVLSLITDKLPDVEYESHFAEPSEDELPLGIYYANDLKDVDKTLTGAE